MRSRLALYVSAMALGVAALVAIRSFGINLERAVAEQAKEVFGSDLEVRRSAAFPDSTAALLDSLQAETGAAVVREVSFPSMARFPASAGGEGRARLAPGAGDRRAVPALRARPLDAGRGGRRTRAGRGGPRRRDAPAPDGRRRRRLGPGRRRDVPHRRAGGRGAGAGRDRQPRRPARLPPARRGRLDAAWVREPGALRGRVPVRRPRAGDAGGRVTARRLRGPVRDGRRGGGRRSPRPRGTSRGSCRSSGSWRCSWAGSAWRRR